jgi:hypothetical protein
MVNAANHAVEHHPHWKKEFERLEPHLGRSKAIVAIARKLLVAVWHVLNEQGADRFAGIAGQTSTYKRCLGPSTVEIGAFRDEEVKEVLGLEERIEPLYIMPVGRPV